MRFIEVSVKRSGKVKTGLVNLDHVVGISQSGDGKAIFDNGSQTFTTEETYDIVRKMIDLIHRSE